MAEIVLTAQLVENFAGAYLSPMYDNPVPTPPFHRACWALYCSEVELAAVAAPRGHAKSTALTHDFILATVLFRFESHVMLVSSSEELAMGQLGDIAKELRENDELRADFGVVKLLTDAKGEIIVLCDDGYEFRILARGVEQRVRGIKWKGRRPGLIVGDDMEEDEQVENAIRRRKLSRWVNRALIPMGRKGCKVRFHGTIIHQDSLLAKMMGSKEWQTLFYKAHAGFDDFTQILWPEQYSEARLRKIRQRFIDDMDAGGYSQEMLNDPQDNEEAYLKKEQFLPMTEEDREVPKVRSCGVDFAISQKTSANRTAFVVAGADTSNLIHFEDVRVGRFDSEEIVEEFFSLNAAWRDLSFEVESGQIWLAIKPILEKEQRRKGIYLDIRERTPIKDKAARGRAWQKRMKARACRFDKEASWYPPYEEEVLRFTGVTDAKLDDQFDASALAVLGLERAPDVEEEDILTEDEWMDRWKSRASEQTGRSLVTGY